MAFDGGWGVSEGFGDDGHGCEFGEFVVGSESCGPCAEQLAEACCEVSWVDVSSGGGAAEYPLGIGVSGGQVVA